MAAMSCQRLLRMTVPGCFPRSEEHTSELQSLRQLVCRLLLEKKRVSRHVPSSRVLHVRVFVKSSRGRQRPRASYGPPRSAPALSKVCLEFTVIFFLMIGRPPKSTLFPYTALSR